MSTPILGGLYVVEIAKEGNYGVDPGGGVQIPVYGSKDPVKIESNLVGLRRSQRGLGSSGVRQAFSTWNIPSFQTYVYGSGAAETPPPWMTLLDGCAMERSNDPVDAGRSVWRNSPSPTPSLTIGTYLGNRKYVASGSRGAWGIEGEAGRPVSASFSFSAPYRTSTLATRPVSINAPDSPPRLCAAGFVISPLGEPVITPVLKSFKITDDCSMLAMNPSRKSGGVREFRHTGRTTTWSAVMELDDSIDWFEWYNSTPAKTFGLTITVGQEVGKRVRFRTYQPFPAEIAQDPSFQLGNDGILLVNLVFGIKGRKDDALEIVHE